MSSRASFPQRGWAGSPTNLPRSSFRVVAAQFALALAFYSVGFAAVGERFGQIIGWAWFCGSSAWVYDWSEVGRLRAAKERSMERPFAGARVLTIGLGLCAMVVLLLGDLVASIPFLAGCAGLQVIRRRAGKG